MSVFPPDKQAHPQREEEEEEEHHILGGTLHIVGRRDGHVLPPRVAARDHGPQQRHGPLLLDVHSAHPLHQLHRLPHRDG